jgi:large subunit ribosomal protein L1
VSFDADKLVDNLAALASAIVKDRPDSIKGPFFRSAYITSTMGPSVQLDLPTLQALESPE